MGFAELGLSDEALRAVADAGYNQPTPIQEQAIPIVLQGRDVLGTAQTGTGKTASFTLPMIDILAAGRAKARMPRSLILEPTRELAAQVQENFKVYGKYHKLTVALLIGGVRMEEQVRLIDRGVDVLIATPGRLLDHAEHGGLLLGGIKVLVIDEADRMLDMGFIPDVEKIVKLAPPLRQTLLFSATMPKEIRRLADRFLQNPKSVSVAPPASPAETVDQMLIYVDAADKREALRSLLKQHEVPSALIFCNRKRDIGVLTRSLKSHGYDALELHGDMSQPARTETLEKFRRGEFTILVCSDVAARGLDIQGLPYVFLYDVPTHAEDYVHRIGRTGRAGMVGRAITLATHEEAKYVGQVETLIGRAIPMGSLPGLEQGQPDEDQKRGRKSRSGRGRSGKRDAPAEKTAPTAAAAEPTKDAAEDAPKPRSRRRRSRSDAAPKSEAAAAAPRESSQPQETSAKPAARQSEQREPRHPRRDRQDRQDRDDKAVVGLGDHVPAFLMAGIPAANVDNADGGDGDGDEKKPRRRRKTS
ncbi:MAG: DEAD/DEAH box helicase [Alphaproteobacteria bacterium]